MIFSALIIFFKKNVKEKYFFKANSKETFILANNWFMAFFLITVLIGTTYPIFTEVISDLKISVGPPFYNIVIIPFVIPLLILMAVAPGTKWIKNHFEKSFLLIVIIASSLIINILIIYFLNVKSILTNLIIISAVFLIIHSFIDLLKDKNKKITSAMPRIISHVGFGFLILFIGLNHNFSFDKDFNIKEGEIKKFDTYNINFQSLKFNEKQNYKSVIGIFDIFNSKDNSKKTLKPEIRIYNQPSTLTYEASIISNLSHDLYLTMSNLKDSQSYNIKFQKKPFMLWIWISALLIVFGGFLRIFKHEN